MLCILVGSDRICGHYYHIKIIAYGTRSNLIQQTWNSEKGKKLRPSQLAVYILSIEPLGSKRTSFISLMISIVL